MIDKGKTTFDGKIYHLDVICDVCNLAPVFFVSEYFGISLKTVETPDSVYTEQEVYFQLTILFMFIFTNFDPENSFKLTQTAKKFSEQLHNITVCKKLLIQLAIMHH